MSFPSDLLHDLDRLISSSDLNLQPFLTPKVLEQFRTYHRELQKWNKTIKLTGIQTFKDFVDRHLLDSLVALPFISRLSPGDTILDVGSGAGFPGLPLAMIFPEMTWILIESRQRRSAFLSHLQRTFALSNVQVLTARVAGNPDNEGIIEEARMLMFRAVNPQEILPLSTLYLKEEGECLYWATQNTPLKLPESLFEKEGLDYQLPSGESFCLRRFGRKDVS